MQPEPLSTFHAERRAALDARSGRRWAQALDRFRAAAAAHPADRWNRNDVALALQALGRLAEARAEAEALLGEAPDFGPAHRTLGLLARAEGDAAAALVHFQAAAERDTRDLWNRYDAASALRTLGRSEDAASAFEAVAEGTPLAHALRSLAEIARDAGRHAEALDLFRVAARLRPADPWFAFDIVLALDRLGRRDDAEAALADLRARHAAFLPAVRHAAEAAARRGDHEAARRHWQAALDIAPGDAALARSLAETLLKLGHADEAETRFVHLLLVHPGDAGCYLGLARIARLRGGSLDIAAAHLKAAEAAAGAEPFARMAVAAEWLALGEPSRARRICGELGERCETAAAVELAALVRRTDGPKAARRLLEQAVERAPDHPRALLLLADERRDRGRLEEAEALYDRALAVQPDFYWALVGKAAVARGRGLADDAGRHLDAAAAIDPGEGFAQIERAADLRAFGRTDEALRRLASIPATSPRAAQAAMAEAFVLRAAGDWEEASRLFESVARRWPSQADALVEAAEDAFRAGMDARAALCLEEAGRAAPNHPLLLEALARRAMIQDEPEEALALYRRAEAADPSRLSPALAAARLLMVLGRTGEGLAAFDAAEDRFGERPDIVLARAEMQRQLGLPEAGESLLRDGRVLFPHHAGLRVAEIHALIDAGRFEDAATALDAAPCPTPAEAGRVAFARSLLHAARFEFEDAVRHGEAAAAALPGDGWVVNRLIHAALLDLDMERAGRHLGALARLEASASRLRGKSANASQSHYGQIFDEFRLGDEALAALQDTRALPPETALRRVAGIVREHPGSTAAAIRFFILRRLAGETASFQAAGEPIPRRIHQYWNDPAPPRDLESLIKTWRAAHPGFAHRLWDDAAARHFLQGLPGPQILSAYERAEEPAMKADLFRLALLAEEGGLYADADDRCLRSLEPLLRGRGFVAYQEDLGSLGNNVLAARPRHPVIQRARDLAVAAVNRGDSDILWLATGPGLLTRAAAEVFAGQPAVMEDALILERHALLRHVSIHCLAAYKTTERHWSRTAFGGSRQTLPKAS